MDYQNQNQYVSVEHGFMSKVYSWLCAGLAVSAGVSYYIMNTPELLHKMNSSFGLMIGLMVVMFGLIFYISFRFATMSYASIVFCFGLFTVIQGIFLAPILNHYTNASIVNVFITAALMFLSMAIYGSVTKTDLSSMGNILRMGLWGLIICGLVNMFLHSSMLDTIMSACGVGIFTMLIAYDVQMLKKMSQQAMMHPQDVEKFAVMGALNLYLNMINLFLYLLRLFGEEKKK